MKGKCYYTNLRNPLKNNNFNFALENSGHSSTGQISRQTYVVDNSVVFR